MSSVEWLPSAAGVGGKVRHGKRQHIVNDMLAFLKDAEEKGCA